jgi:beta-xylosidase
VTSAEITQLSPNQTLLADHNCLRTIWHNVCIPHTDRYTCPDKDTATLSLHATYRQAHTVTLSLHVTRRQVHAATLSLHTTQSLLECH